MSNKYRVCDAITFLCGAALTLVLFPPLLWFIGEGLFKVWGDMYATIESKFFSETVEYVQPYSERAEAVETIDYLERYFRHLQEKNNDAL